MVEHFGLTSWRHSSQMRSNPCRQKPCFLTVLPSSYCMRYLNGFLAAPKTKSAPSALGFGLTFFLRLVLLARIARDIDINYFIAQLIETR